MLAEKGILSTTHHHSEVLYLTHACVVLAAAPLLCRMSQVQLNRFQERYL
jgi:hypothetical protein